MRYHSSKNIINVCLAGHGGSGKTSLAESLLFYSKATDRLGKISEGNTICDFDPEEIKRKTSVSCAVAPFEWANYKINLIDTPGLFDFAGEMCQGIKACDCVLITVSGKSGVTVGAQKAYDLAIENDKATMIFVGKMDSEHADFYKVFEELKTNFGPSVCPIVVPFVENHKVTCYINLLDMKAYSYSGGVATEVAMPDFGHRLDGLIAAVSEAVAETDEELMEKYFSGEQFTKDELIKGIHDGVKTGKITPVFCGCALNLDGIDMLLDGMTYLMPSAFEKTREKATDDKGEVIDLKCAEDKPLLAFVFKTVADPFVGKLSYFKVISGKLTPDMAPINARTGNPERLGKLLCVRGKKQEDADFIDAGDIGAVSKLGETMTGDTLCDPKRILTIEPMKFPKPSMSMAVVIKNKGDEGKISQALTRLKEEDPTMDCTNNTETKQQIISGLGEQHLDVIVSKIKSKFGIDIGLVQPRVAYRETIRKKVKVQGRHKKQSGGHGQYGDVWIEFEPCDSEELVFAENVFGGSVPKNFFPAVEKGLRDCAVKGVVAGYPVVGLKATLVDGSYHPVDSSEMSFKMAASIAYKEGLVQANPIILEPIGTLSAFVPDANTGDVMGELNKRRGRVMGMNPADKGMQEIVAEVPMSEMHDFTTFLRSMTQGRGYFTLEFTRYDPLPSALEAKVIEDAKAVNAE